MRRLFPALIVVLAVCWAIGWFELLPPELVQLGRHVIGGAGFVANFVLWSEAWYFDTAVAAKPLLHLWSLGVEEQFDLFWPLTLVVLWRVAAIAWLGVAHQGYPRRFAFPPAIDRLAMGAYDIVAGARYHTCWLDGEAPADGFAPECRTPSRPAGETVVLWGDSYAARLHPGLPEALQFTRNACPPLLMVGTPGCHRANAFVLEEIAHLKPGTVVLRLGG